MYVLFILPANTADLQDFVSGFEDNGGREQRLFLVLIIYKGTEFPASQFVLTSFCPHNTHLLSCWWTVDKCNRRGQR